MRVCGTIWQAACSAPDNAARIDCRGIKGSAGRTPNSLSLHTIRISARKNRLSEGVVPERYSSQTAISDASSVLTGRSVKAVREDEAALIS